MTYAELELPWQRVFTLAWESLLQGSKAIAAVITTETGEIISEGRNRIAENAFPNEMIAHAELEAVMNLDTTKYPTPKQYILYAGLEPCPMCMGTIVMGHIRHLQIAARDSHGGAVELLDKSEFLRNKCMRVSYAPSILGYVQRTLQAIRELVYTKDEFKKEQILNVIQLLHPRAVDVAKEMVESGFVAKAIEGIYTFPEVFDVIIERFD